MSRRCGGFSRAAISGGCRRSAAGGTRFSPAASSSAGGCAARPAGPPSGARRRVPLGRRRARRAAVTGSSRRAAVLIALGAALLALSYPPFRFPLLSFVAVAPAVVLVRELGAAADVRRAPRLRFWYGLASQGLVLYWLVVALWHFTPLSALGDLATIAIYGLWTAGLFWLPLPLRPP